MSFINGAGSPKEGSRALASTMHKELQTRMLPTESSLATFCLDFSLITFNPQKLTTVHSRVLGEGPQDPALEADNRKVSKDP